MDHLTPEAERSELDGMLKMGGWAIYVAHVEQAWGPAACEQALRDARRTTTPEEWPFESARILDTFAAMRANLRWPEERLRELKAQTTDTKVDLMTKLGFGHLREAGR